MTHKKAPNFVMLSTKGGVGRSFIAFEIIAPYLLKMGYEPEIRSLDIVSTDDAAFYYNTAIKTKRVPVHRGDKVDLLTNLHEIIDFDDQAVVIDVGSRTFCKAFIEALVLNDSLLDLIDCIIIPINDNDIAVQGAFDVINLFKSEPRLEKALSKIVIAINKLEPIYTNTNTDCNEIEKRYYNAFDLMHNHNLKWFTVNNMDAIENLTNMFRLTIFELSKQTEVLKPATINQMREVREASTKAGDSKKEIQDKIANLRNERLIINEIQKNQKYYEISINSAFTQLDQILT